VLDPGSPSADASVVQARSGPGKGWHVTRSQPGLDPLPHSTPAALPDGLASVPGHLLFPELRCKWKVPNILNLKNDKMVKLFTSAKE
jgi:hypothetical protein